MGVSKVWMGVAVAWSSIFVLEYTASGDISSKAVRVIACIGQIFAFYHLLNWQQVSPIGNAR